LLIFTVAEGDVVEDGGFELGNLFFEEREVFEDIFE
jgi:hypothetical protein